MTQNRFLRGYRVLEDTVAYTCLALLVLFPVAEVVARKLFHTGIPSSADYIHHLVLLITCVGAMITMREGKHLSLSLKLVEKPAWSVPLRVVGHVLSVAILSAGCISSLSFVWTAFVPGQKVGFIPVKLVAMAIPLVFFVMVCRLLRRIPLLPWLFGPLACLAGALLAYGSLSNLLQSLGGPAVPAQDIVQGVVKQAVPVTVVVLVLSAFAGVRIFIILGGVALLLFARAAEPLEIIANEAYAMLMGHSIPAIPLFALAGFILSESNAGKRLVALFQAVFSWFPGGMAIVAILVCAFFTTFTGASGVTILALGALLSYTLVQSGYKKSFSIGLLTASGSVGLLFPPSLPIIIYGIAAQVSIKDMFIGGILPGLVMILALVVLTLSSALRSPVERRPFRWRATWPALKQAVWEALLPFVVLVAFFSGLATLVESAALAVVYALIVEGFVHRDLTLSKLVLVARKCIPVIGGVLIILAMAKGLSYYMVDAEIPVKLTHWAQSTIHSKYVFLLVLNVGLLVTGCFMDIFSAIMVVVPLIIPLGVLYNVHPVHLGIIFLANMELGYLTPPVGLNLFLASYRFNESTGRVYRYVLPFFLVQLLSVLLITYLPFLATALLDVF